MADDDSRTATLGRKRQRDFQDEPTNARFATPEKKVKLAEDDCADDDESDYSPSPDLPQLEPSREPPANQEQQHLDFPHMAGADESTAKAGGLSAAQEKAGPGKPSLPPPEADDFIALPTGHDLAAESEHSPNGSANGAGSEAEGTGKGGTADTQATAAQPPHRGPGRMAVSKKQSHLILAFEEERSLRILKHPVGAFWSPKKGFRAQNAEGAIVSMNIPQVPDKKDPTKMLNGIQHDAICNRVVTAIGSNCPNGLLGLYYDHNQTSRQFTMLVVVRTQDHFDTLRKFFADNPLEFSLKGAQQKSSSKDFYFLSVSPATPDSKKLQMTDNRKLTRKRGITPILAQALAHYVKRRLEAGDMSPADYEGFNPKISKKTLQKAAKEDIGAGAIKADPVYAWDHLAPAQPKPASKGQSQATSKQTSAASTKPSTPASEAQDTNFSSGEEGEISSEPASNEPPPESPQDAVQNNDGAAAATAAPSDGQMRTHFTQLTESEKVLQVRYFGEPEDGLVRCLTCAQKGHMKESCPSRTCDHCQAIDRHFTRNCPTITKCEKCRETGHAAENCPLKLARSAADGCELCSQTGHLGDRCALNWCSFDPSNLPALNKVQRLNVSCYQCGSPQHWGDDCPMRPRASTAPPHASNIFSAQAADRYLVDPQAAAEELLSRRQPGPGMSIRGRAQGQNQHTYFSSEDGDDDDDDDAGDIDNFYRSRRGNNNNGPAARGNIRINAGAGFRGGRFSQKNERDGGGGGGGGGGGNQFEPISSGWRPPLPNEPPPPLPPMPPSRGGGGNGGGRGGGRGGRSGRGGGVNQMPLPPRQAPSGPSRKPWRGGGRGGKR